MRAFSSLVDLGWQAHFQQQLSLEEWQNLSPARVLEQHRSELVVANESEEFVLPIVKKMPELVVGDWLLVDEAKQFVRSLERKTCFSRKAAGTQVKRQLISANVDTAFIVSSLNEDFNLNRLERFLSLVNESAAQSVIILSKRDLCSDSAALLEQVQSLDPLLEVEVVNCLQASELSVLSAYLQPGKTIAILGSSGVGKSTLVNSLLGEQQQETATIREDDAKGRHTTTRRSLILLPQGALLLDTPGMRELQLENSEQGISATFNDIETLAKDCRFSDCAHKSEPACAVLQAIAQGRLEQRRLDNYHKLCKENALNSASLSERRASDKALGKFYKRTLKQSKALKGRDD